MNFFPGHILTPFLIFRGTVSPFSKATAPSHTNAPSTRGFQFLHILTCTCCPFPPIVTTPMCTKWHLIVVLTCVYLVDNDFERLFPCLLAFCVFSLETDVYLSTHILCPFLIELFEYIFICGVHNFCWILPIKKKSLIDPHESLKCLMVSIKL